MIAARPAPVEIAAVPGGYEVRWLGEPICAKPEPTRGKAEGVANYLLGLSASERRLWVEGRG